MLKRKAPESSLSGRMIDWNWSSSWIRYRNHMMSADTAVAMATKASGTFWCIGWIQTLITKRHEPEQTCCTMEKNHLSLLGCFLCKCRKKYCLGIKKKSNQIKQRQLWILGKCEFPTELGRLWDQTEVVLQLFSQTTQLGRVKQVRTAMVGNTSKLLLHKKTWRSLWTMIKERLDPSGQTRRSAPPLRVMKMDQ